MIYKSGLFLGGIRVLPVANFSAHILQQLAKYNNIKGEERQKLPGRGIYSALIVPMFAKFLKRNS